MAAAAVSVRSLEARFACEENIYVEIAQNHIGMLDEFAAAAGAHTHGGGGHPWYKVWTDGRGVAANDSPSLIDRDILD
jgi:hypothetical protein